MSSSLPWHPEDIKAAIKKTGVTLRDLANRNGSSPAVLSSCMRQPLPTGNRIISEYLGVPLHVLWPHWYLPDGSLRPDARKTSTADALSRRQKRASA